MNLILAMRFITSPFVSQEVKQQMLPSVWWPLSVDCKMVCGVMCIDLLEYTV